jgi:D-glycero-alpha-D-manno-heptose-7-phosphate kinase
VRIDRIISRAQEAGATGWKAMGASGGGCVLVLSAADNADAVRDAIAPLGELLPFAIEPEGPKHLGHG